MPAGPLGQTPAPGPAMKPVELSFPGPDGDIVHAVYDSKEHSFHCKLYLTFHRTLLHFVFGFMKKSVFNFKPW